VQGRLKSARAQGYATDVGEALADVCCLAAPVHDKHGAVVAAMSLAIPSYRFERVRLRALEPLQAAAGAVSKRLGTADRGIL
jgi:IclR family KDG regulon transcriptional repressor